MDTSRILILFTSKDGNTAQMAELVACGSPTNLGVLSWQMKRWRDEVALDAWAKIDGKIGCAFSSEGGLGGGADPDSCSTTPRSLHSESSTERRSRRGTPTEGG